MTLVPDPAGVPPQTARLANPANGLTLLRLLLVPVFAALLLHQDGTDTAWRIAATVAFGIAAITDRVDGQLARSRGLVTEFGKLADPIADKALTGTALVGLSALGLLWWWVTAVILGREIGVTLLRFWVIRHGVIPASRGGKAKTFAQNCAIGLYVMPLPDSARVVPATIMAVALALTVITGFDYVSRALTLRRAGRARARSAVPKPTPPATPPPPETVAGTGDARAASAGTDRPRPAAVGSPNPGESVGTDRGRPAAVGSPGDVVADIAGPVAAGPVEAAGTGGAEPAAGES